MAKKYYIDTDVYTEAKKRIRKVINSFDSVIVAFSGGKDSLCVLNLVQEVYEELGIKEKVKVIFRDEELIPDDVVRFVQSKAESGLYDFRYYAVPLKSQKFILGSTEEYVQWDRNRKHLRTPPSYAITLPKDDKRIFDQYTMDSFCCKDEKGRVAIINGIRADESLLRFNASCIKKNENYINRTEDPRIKLVKPIFDWTEQDIFTYFYKKHIDYCVIYDMQTFNGDKLRVSTPLHAESSKMIYKLQTLYPVFFQQLVELFPDVLLQARYYTEMAKGEDNFEGYPPTIEGIIQFANDTIRDKKMASLAVYCIEQCAKRRRETGSKTYGGYPLRHILKSVQNGSYKRGRIFPTDSVGALDEAMEEQARQWKSRFTK